MISSSDTFGKIKLAAVSSMAPDTPTAALYTALLKEFRRNHVDAAEHHLAKMKLNACDGCYASGGRTCLLPCDYNDIDEELYDPSDKGVLITDSLVDCELLLVVAEARCGGLDSLTQRFLERLKPFDNLARLQHQRLLDNKFAVVVAVGDGADAAVGQMTARLLGLGLSIPAYGSISVEIESFWTRDHGLKVVQGDGDVQHRLQACVSSAIKQASSVKRR